MKRFAIIILTVILSLLAAVMQNSCKKDVQPTMDATPPTVSTHPASIITNSTAKSGGNVTSEGSSEVTTRGVCWSTATNPSLSDQHTIDSSGTGTFISNLSGLSGSTTYYIRAYASNGVGTAYGAQKSFMTLDDTCGTTLIDSRDGQQYPTVQIGTQCWMAKNLNIGVLLSGIINQTNNSTIEKYCYNNDTNYCATYGGLYQWGEIMNYTTTPGVKGICPTGWHIPTDTEWYTLTDYLGGDIIAGGKMKEMGTTHWNSPNNGATNSSGFTALGAGYRYDNGNSYDLRDLALFWSSSEYSSSLGIYRLLSYDYALVYRFNSHETYGYSVRCLRNN